MSDDASARYHMVQSGSAIWTDRYLRYRARTSSYHFVISYAHVVTKCVCSHFVIRVILYTRGDKVRAQEMGDIVRTSTASNMVSNEERANGLRIKNMDSHAGRPEDRHPATIIFIARASNLSLR